MSLPNNFCDGTLIGVVCGGDINDPAPDQSCNMKVIIPGLHGKDVKCEHLAFSTMMKPATNYGQQSFEGTLDPGSVVFVRKDTGSNQCHIIGTGNEIYDPNCRVPGNMDLLSIPQIVKALQQTIDIRIPPTIQETIKQGVKIREKQEKGQLHKHELLKGIPANGAIYPLAGSIIPELKNVATAVEQFTSILSPAMASLLPGVNVSLSSILGTLTSGNPIGALAGAVSGAASGAISQIAKELGGEVIGKVAADATSFVSSQMAKELSRELAAKMDPGMKMSLQSMSLLTSSIETGVGGDFTSGDRVDPQTYLMNAADLLKQCKGVGDLVECMRQLQYDDSLFGQDKLADITIEIDTPFGFKMPMKISPSGNITQNIPEPLKKAIGAFQSLMSSASGFPGVNPGQNLFGDSAKVMFDMFGRLSPQAQKTAVELSKVLNTSETAKLFAEVNKKTVQGGNMLQAILKKG
jgi:hypothetical protein